MFEMMVPQEVQGRGVIIRTFRSWNLFFIFAVLTTAMIACGSESSEIIEEFMNDLHAGASCEELFVMRNSVDPSDPITDRMNRELRSIGCYSSSSERTDLAGQPSEPKSEGSNFTVEEYQLYRSVIDTLLSVPEDQAIQRAAEEYGVTIHEVQITVENVMSVLAYNGWYGTPESEIRRASDWQD